MEQSEILQALLSRMPYPNQICDISLGEINAVRFNWRGNVFRVSKGLFVEEVVDGMLSGSNTAILLQHLLKVKA